jgi:hypothetical protein
LASESPVAFSVAGVAQALRVTIERATTAMEKSWQTRIETSGS